MAAGGAVARNMLLRRLCSAPATSSTAAPSITPKI
jgi:hypothetical protein